MAAAVKALNAKIRSNPVADYVCSTHFWGPRSPDVISGPMTFALCGYSGVFMRYAMAVTPRNCVNFSAQATQGYRYVNYWHMGGRETAAKEGQAPEMVGVVGDKAKEVGSQVKEGAQEVKGKVEEQVEKIRK